MSGPSGFTFGAPPVASASRPGMLSSSQMINFGSFLPAGNGQRGACQSPYRLRNRHLDRKRRTSAAGGPARKRRAAEECMIGDLENLSLSSWQTRKSKSRFERWQELEARLAAEPADPDEQDELDELDEASSDDPRLVISEELHKLISSPAPDVIPDVKTASSCTALVLWQPPPVPPIEPPDDRTTEPPPEPLELDEAAPPPAAPAYDFSPFSPFCAAGPAEPQPFLFGVGGAPVPCGWPGVGTAAAEPPRAFQFGAAASSAGLGFGTPQPADELMEL